MSKRRVVITGLGVMSSVGLDLAENRKNIFAGVSGISTISSFDPEEFSCKIAGEMADFDVNDYMSAKEARKMDRFMQLGYITSLAAMDDSGLEITDSNSDRVGVYIGSGIGGLGTIEATTGLFNERGPRRVSPFFVPSAIINMISGNVSIEIGARGPNLSMVTACTSGTHSIGEASRLIEYGDADVMIAGGAEAAITQTGIAGFGNSKALSTREVDPLKASCPWDEARDGFIMGEGAGVLVLEELEHAKARGARIYAELSGFGMSADAHHMTSPHPDGDGAARCMAMAMKHAELNPADIDYINAHGTSTPQGDVAQTKALKRALGEAANSVAISSTKSMVGHLLGAAGGVEAVYTALAISDQIAPPTINLHNPSPECDLDYVPNVARDMRIRAALSNSFGFGGTNGTLAFKAYT
ncbi:MAG TPA: beta-ketoacyl-[acyl-carrier-protein] synthase II [Gammaproteobacteria bacterium]|nr:beta-ketoacyl-[acyl-carrier-protein] synthase II [Gammaproteobacteria bacterium]